MRFALLVIGALLLASPTASSGDSRFFAVGEETSQIEGHYEFCESNPSECEPSDPVGQISWEAWEETVVGVNEEVNYYISPVDDLPLGEDHWEIASGESPSGDCEEYVLTKMSWLKEAGVPQSAMRITVVLQFPGNEKSGHAVLTVRTDEGDMVLDNLTDRIVTAGSMPYQPLKFSSGADPKSWRKISKRAVDKSPDV